MTGTAASTRDAAPRAPRAFASELRRHSAIADLLRASLLPIAATMFLVAGGLVRFRPGTEPMGRTIWLTGLVLTGAPIVWRTLRGVLAGHFAADLVAALAIITAVPLGQGLAGLVIVIMQSGGEALERHAEGRASSAVRALEEAAPRMAHRVDAGGELEDIEAGEITVDDVLLVRPGELVPCDALVIEGRSHVDTSRLTGEPIPVSTAPGTRLMSGSANGESPLTVRALAIAGESQYARIVELVRTAQSSKAPLQRTADRFAVWFTPITVAMCVVTFVASRDWARVLAVLVVATPCPLILATPVAIVGGINRAARRQVIVRTGAALEQLARITVGVFDKTGTLTIGRPRVSAVRAASGLDERDLLRLAAAVERGSGHLLARAIEDAAAEQGVVIPAARHVHESAGRGIAGIVDERDVVVGARGFVLERYPALSSDLDRLDGGAAGLRSYVAVDGAAAGVIEYADMLRPGLATLFRDLRALGVGRTMLLSGDHEANAQAVARELGISEVRGELLPEEKLAIVEQLLDEGERVLVVGDGTNDAPALSRASVGIALAAHGGGISAEAADAVILVDDVTRVADAVRIGRRTMRIARQSIWAGLGASGLAMIAAALGFVPPVGGAVLQEAIDVVVILNALRTSRTRVPMATGPLSSADGQRRAARQLRSRADERSAAPPRAEG